MKQSFLKLKERVHNEVKLYLPNYNKTFTLETDASYTGIGACLIQEDNLGILIPIGWTSRKLSKA